MTRTRLLILLLSPFLLFSCKKKEIELKDQQIKQLQEQVDNLKNTNTNLLDRMADMSIINKTGAESIKKSIENISQQYEFIEDLTSKVQAKDSINMSLVLNLKRSLGNINDDDISVEVRGGVVHVSIADKLLFSSGSSQINPAADRVLSKIATVINDHEELEVNVEGHTDNVPVNLSCVDDNWDLSVKRATAVVRALQEKYYVNPMRMVASGRAEYFPKADNTTAEGRSINRRTEIVIQPRLDQFFELLENPEALN